MKFAWRMPNLHFGFPVELEEGSTKPSVQEKSRGVALMIAVMIISIMIMFATDFIVSASVDLTLATAQRDNIRAEYVAKSGANWALWLNLFDYGCNVRHQRTQPCSKQRKLLGHYGTN